MKKLILSITALLVLGISGANAQGFKGKTFIMGQAGFGTEADGNIQNYSILPVVGHFIAPTTAIGIGIGYLGSTDKTVENVKATTGTFIVQPLARKYWPVSDNFLIFGQAAVPLSFSKATVESNGTKVDGKATGYGIAIAPGIDYFLSSKFSIEATFGLASWSSIKPDGGEATNDFNINLNSGFMNGVKFGIKYVF